MRTRPPAKPGRWEGIDVPTLAAVSAGHFIVDMCQGTIPVLLPFLMTRLHLNYLQTGMIVTTTYITSSVTQPLFGLIPIPAIQRGALPVGVLLACVLLALAAQMPSYPLVLLAVVLSSAGVAMYHPEAAATANRVSGTVNKSRGMSVFAMCGSVGFTFGPLVFGPIVAGLGLPGALFLLVPAAVVPALVFRAIRRLHAPAAAGASPRPAAKADEPMASWSRLSPFAAMALLVTVVAIARWAAAGTMTFLPLYFDRYLGQPPAVGNRAMAAFQIGGDVGTFVSGLLVARFGSKKTLIAAMACATPVLLAYYHLTGVPCLAMLFLSNFAIAMTVLTTTLLGQEYLPNNKALAASMTLGLGVGLGGLGSGLLGRIADVRGIESAMLLAGIAPILGALVAFILPERKRRKI